MINGKHGIHAVYLNQSWNGLPRFAYNNYCPRGNLMKFANKHHQVVDGGSQWTWKGPYWIALGDWVYPWRQLICGRDRCEVVK